MKKPKPAKTPPKPAPGKKPAKAKHPAKPMSPKQYREYLRYVRKHEAERKAREAKRAAHHTHAKVRKWSPDGDVALCSARAVAESLRLATGVAVADDDVLGLYWATASDPDQGQSVYEALSAAQELFGFREVMPCATRDHDYSAVPDGNDNLPWPRLRVTGAGLILGLDLPGAETHAVAVGPDGTWWSWGEPFDPADWPGLVIDEAWAIEWR